MFQLVAALSVSMAHDVHPHHVQAFACVASLVATAQEALDLSPQVS